MLRQTIAAFALVVPALAHMEISWPPPLKSKYNPANTDPDWSMTNPLAGPNGGSGGTFPCKGYINAPGADMSSQASWDAGSTVNFTLAGSATHGGGSCQMSMSYDEGKTWSVIESYMGGCPIDTLTYEVQIPQEAPSGEALFGWTWFNKVGNREMYMNCAVVTVSNGGSGLDSATFPEPFVANVEAAPDCATIEGVSVVFPNPGSNVIYGGEYASTKPTDPTGFTGSCGAAAPGGDNTTTSGAASNSGAASTISPAASVGAGGSGSSSVVPPAGDAATTTEITDPTGSTGSPTAPITDGSSTTPSGATPSVAVYAADDGSDDDTSDDSAAGGCPRKVKVRKPHVEKRHQRLLKRAQLEDLA